MGDSSFQLLLTTLVQRLDDQGFGIVLPLNQKRFLFQRHVVLEVVVGQQVLVVK